MVSNPLKMPIFLQFMQKLHSYGTRFYRVQAHLFTCLTRLAVKFATYQ